MWIGLCASPVIMKTILRKARMLLRFVNQNEVRFMSKKEKTKQRRQAYKNYPKRINSDRGFDIPKQLCLDTDVPGIFFGLPNKKEKNHYVGMPQGTDGNILVIGGNGSGKSSGIIKPTLSTWNGAICATDIKGELSEQYERLSAQALQKGVIMRPSIVFDPTQANGMSYDPFWWILQDDPANLCTNIMDIAYTIIPKLPNDIQPFWGESEQSVFAAALCYYFNLGLSFNECLFNLASDAMSYDCRCLQR